MNNFQNPAIIIPGGSSAVLVSETFTANGEYVASDYNADGFSSVFVQVGATVLTAATFASNGTYQAVAYNADGFSSVEVAVPEPVLVAETFTQNGDYLPASYSADGFTAIHVAVPPSTFTSAVLATNGTFSASAYNADGFSTVEVAVPSGPSFEGKFHQMITRTISEITPEDLQGIDRVGSFAFQSCSSLTFVHIPSDFVRLEYASFSDCTSLATVIIDDLDGSMTIGGNSFAYCSALTSFTMGEGVWYLDGYSFYQSGLLSIELPSTISNIGEAVFQGCYDLTQVTIRSTTPPVLSNSSSFDGSYPIYVPAESVEAYKSATNWSALASRIQAIPT